MMWIGLTGNTGSGKSTVSRMLRDRGVPVVDADAAARDVLAPGSPALGLVYAEFGEELRLADGQLDRRGLGRLVFNDPEKLARLENIVHPAVRRAVAEKRHRLESEGHKFAFYDVPLLFEKNMQDQFDGILLIASGEDVAIHRIMKRDSISRAEALARLKSQWPARRKIKHCDWVVHNDGNLMDLELELDRVLQDIGRKLSQGD